MNKGLMFTNIHKEFVKEMTTLEIPENVITELSKEQFSEQLKNNRGLFIVKFGAEWCGPCKRIDPLVYSWMSKMPHEYIQSAIIDIDDYFEIYAFLKSKKMVNGVPAILCYQRGNETYVPDFSVIGADEQQVNMFFQKCLTIIS